MNQWHEAEQHFEKARDLVQQRKWPQALAALRRATDVNPFNAAWLVHLGFIHDELSQYDQALAAYRRAARLEPDNLQTQERLGVDLARTGRLRQALGAFARISQADPAYEAAYCHRIRIHAELGEHDLAEEMFYTARLYKDHCPRCYEYMGRSLESRKQHDKAIFCFQKCLDLDENWPDAVRRLAEAYWNKGDLEQARRHYLIDLRHNPGRPQTLVDLGNVLLEMGRIDEAGEKYRRCIELAPYESAGYRCYGRWLARAGQWEPAQAVFKQALRLDPTSAGVHLELARLALRAGNREQAAEHLRAEHLLHSHDTHILLAMANLWMDCDQDRAAIACLKRLLTLEPAHRGAWLNLAVAQFRRGMYQQGIRSCRQALDLDSGPGRTTCLAMYNLALAHERLGQYDLALEWARRCLRMEPRDAGLQRLELRLRLLRGGWSVILSVCRLFNPNF